MIGIVTRIAVRRSPFITGIDTCFVWTVYCIPFYSAYCYYKWVNVFKFNAYEGKLILYRTLTSGIGFTCMYVGFTLASAGLVTLVFNLNPICSAVFAHFVFWENTGGLENKLLVVSFGCVGLICLSKNGTTSLE